HAPAVVPNADLNARANAPELENPHSPAISEMLCAWLKTRSCAARSRRNLWTKAWRVSPIHARKRRWKWKGLKQATAASCWRSSEQRRTDVSPPVTSGLAAEFKAQSSGGVAKLVCTGARHAGFRWCPVEERRPCRDIRPRSYRTRVRLPLGHPL